MKDTEYPDYDFMIEHIDFPPLVDQENGKIFFKKGVTKQGFGVVKHDGHIKGFGLKLQKYDGNMYYVKETRDSINIIYATDIEVLREIMELQLELRND